MTTDRVLAEILENGLGPAYQEKIRKRYQCDTAEGLFEPEEREYDAGIAALAQTLSPEKMSKLTEYENTCSSLREYAAKYGFLAGLYSGFKQFFTLKHELDGGFAKHISDEIHKMPQMMQHREYYAKIEHRNHLAEALEAEVGCENQYHLVSVACAWEQRAHSASIDGFYLGYHAQSLFLKKSIRTAFPDFKWRGAFSAWNISLVSSVTGKNNNWQKLTNRYLPRPIRRGFSLQITPERRHQIGIRTAAIQPACRLHSNTNHQ